MIFLEPIFLHSNLLLLLISRLTFVDYEHTLIFTCHRMNAPVQKFHTVTGVLIESSLVPIGEISVVESQVSLLVIKKKKKTKLTPYT